MQGAGLPSWQSGRGGRRGPVGKVIGVASDGARPAQSARGGESASGTITMEGSGAGVSADLSRFAAARSAFSARRWLLRSSRSRLWIEGRDFLDTWSPFLAVRCARRAGFQVAGSTRIGNAITASPGASPRVAPAPLKGPRLPGLVTPGGTRGDRTRSPADANGSAWLADRSPMPRMWSAVVGTSARCRMRPRNRHIAHPKVRRIVCVSPHMPMSCTVASAR